MQEKLKQLELLVSQVLARRKAVEEKNAELLQRLRRLEDAAVKFRQQEEELKSLREWKRSTQNTLKRLYARVDKEIQKAQKDQEEVS